MLKKLVITIDGPAGAGKTTVSRKLAGRLLYTYVDTGALYRGIAVAAKRAGVGAEDDSGLADLCHGLALRFSGASHEARLLLNDEDITPLIRTPEITMLASAVSARPVVRAHLLNLQRRLGTDGGVVFEGRDMGTVVFPRADVKFFLDASLEERARRRYSELPVASNQDIDQVKQDMKRRDANDSSREIAPLQPAEDAVLIDSTILGIDGVVDKMLSVIQARFSA